MSEVLRSLGPILLALGAGACLVVQATISSSLRAALGSWAWPGLISYVGGTLAMLLVLALRREPWPSAGSAGLNPTYWTAGLFGALYLVLAILLLPRLGAATLVGGVVTGQMLFALVADQFGWLGLPQHSASTSRVLGAGFLIVGMVLIRR